MGLTEDLHDLVDNLPPQGFELDELIQRRRARRTPSRALVAVAGFAAVALVIGGGYALKSGPHPATGQAAQVGAAPTRTAAPTPTPSPTPDNSATLARLTAVLAHLPSALHVPANAKFTSAPAPDGGDTVIYDSPQYSVSWTYKGVTYSVFAAHQPEKPNPNVNACTSGSGGACTQDGGDKSGGVTYRLIFPTKHGAKAFRLSADYTAAGGTNVIVGAWATNNRLVIPTTLMPDLVTAAHNPGFILAP